MPGALIDVNVNCSKRHNPTPDLGDRMLNQMSFKRRILLLLATAVVGVAAQVIINVVQSYEDTLDRKSVV